MKLLYFSRDYTTHDHRFLSALAQSEHQVYFLRLERRGHQLEDRPLPPEVQQIPWAGGSAPAALGDGPRLLNNLKRVIRQVKPDLIQAGPLQRSAFLVALAGFHPLVSMSWGYDLIHDASLNAGWRWATRFTLKRSDLMLGDCNTIRQLAISYGMPSERILTFPWGIDLQHFTPSPSGEAQTEAFNPGQAPFTLLSARSWEPIYGVDVIARAFVKAARLRPNLRLVMLGNGSQAAMLRQTFLSNGLLGTGGSAGDTLDSGADGQPHWGPGVLFPGQISYADLPRFYRSADLYISASHSDGTSISLLEAMACGLPALVSDIPGNQEWVTSGENGWLFPDGDVDALAQAILQAAEQRDQQPEARAAMAHKSRQVAEARANWKENIQLLLDAYKSLVPSHQNFLFH
ncbi:MAG: glycosyltransferase family 4 protein [Chloroflexota bacterium]